mmetsp:Transcript_27344/g.50155  ORF Transcript_27344/g.50155 Transcript_27344/m.50155 type:complete len:238 (+) Transcript_27344:971-1684(+)
MRCFHHGWGHKCAVCRAAHNGGVDLTEIAAHFGRMCGTHQRALTAFRVQRVANGPVFEMVDDPIQQSVFDIPMHNQSRNRRAVFTHVPESAIDDMLRHAIDIFRVIHDDARVLAAHLQNNLFSIGISGISKELHARLGRSRKADHVDIHVTTDGFADVGPEPGHHVEHAARHARLHGQFGHTQGGQRRLFGGFQDHRTARRQRRANLPSEHQKREIPGQDKAHDAHGFPDHHRDVII